MASASQEGGGPVAHGVPRVVVGVDGSPESMRALAWAARESRLRGAVLDVVHVDFFRREALEALAPHALTDELHILDRAVERAQALEPGVAVRGRTCDPPVAQALIEASDGAEMLVVGSRGLGGVRGLAMGSVSSECAHHARCPVVIVRPVAAAATAGSPDAVSLPVTGDEAADATTGTG